MSTIVNYAEQKAALVQRLQDLLDNPNRLEGATISGTPSMNTLHHFFMRGANEFVAWRLGAANFSFASPCDLTQLL